MPIDPGQVTWDAPPQKAGGGVILTDPTVQADEARKAAAEARANRAEGRAEGADARAQESSDRGTEAQGKASVLLSRIKGGFSDILEVTARSPQSQEPGILESIRGGLSPVGVGGLVTRKLSDADRRIVADSQVDVLDALLTLGTGAAYNREQLEGQLSSYFPQYGDTPAEIEVKNRRLRRQIEAAKLQAGPLADDLDAAIAPYLGKSGLPTGPTGTSATTAASAGEQTLSEKDLELKAALEDAIARKVDPAELSAIAAQYGQSILPESLDAYEKAGRIGVPKVDPTGGTASTVLGVDPNSSTGAYFVHAANALTSGALDEMAPALGMDAGQVQRAKEILREKYPVASFAGEVAGQTLQMAGATKALGAAGIPKAAAVAEIGGGAAYGAGESNDNRVGGALTGTGAAVVGRKIGEKIFGTAEKEAIAASAEKAGVPPEAMEQVLTEVMQDAAPLTTEAAEEIGTIAKQAIGRGKPARDAKKKLAEMAKINPEAKAAADRMGVDLPLDILSDDAQLKTITGLARSQAGSEAEGSWYAAARQVAKKAEQELENLEATPDLAQVSADVMNRMDSAASSLERQAKALRVDVNDAIDVRTPVDVSKTREVLNALVDDLGGLSKARAALSSEEKKLIGAFGIGDKVSNPTYAYLNRVRDSIGDALYRGVGPWADSSKRDLAKYYAALADDQIAHIEKIGGTELADKQRGANSLFNQMFKGRQRMQAVFGDNLEKDLGPLLKSAVSNASKGDGQSLRKILANVPEDMRGGVLMSGLMAQTTKKGFDGGFSFARYAEVYRGLRQNAPIYKEFAKTIGPQGSQILTDLYVISRRVAEGDSRIIKTGKSNQPILNALNAESLVSKVLDGAVRRVAEAGLSVATGGLAGRSVAGAIGESVQNAVQGSSKSSLEKVHGMLSSDAFRELVEKSATGQDTKRSINRLIGSKEYNNYAARVLGLKTPEHRRQWLQEAVSATSVVGAGRATSETPSTISIEAAPQ